MAVNKHVLLQALRYRGGGTMLTWALHRIGGMAMILFVGVHILSGFSMQQFGSDLGTFINSLYESTYFQIFIYFFVIFHAINGMRIITLDVWPKLLQYQREVTWLQWLIFLPLYGLAVFVMVQLLFAGN